MLRWHLPYQKLILAMQWVIVLKFSCDVYVILKIEIKANVHSCISFFKHIFYIGISKPLLNLEDLHRLGKLIG